MKPPPTILNLRTLKSFSDFDVYIGRRQFWRSAVLQRNIPAGVVVKQLREMAEG